MRGRLTTAAVVFAAGLMMVPAHAASGGTVYVDARAGNDANSGTSPTAAFRTLGRAQQATKSTVMLMPGTFDLTAPLTFGPADSNVTWRAFDPASPPLISGERDIFATAGNRWTYDPSLRVWSLGGVTGLNSRDLWVNGQRAARVHTCVSGEPCGTRNTPPTLTLTSNGVAADPNPHLPVYHAGQGLPYRNPSRVEFVYRFDGEPGRTGVPWTEPRCDVAAVQATEIVMNPCFVTGREENPGGPFHISVPSEIENAFELFDPVALGNQWYWDPSTNVLSWQAPPGVTTPPQSVVAGGLNGTLVKMTGTSNVRFDHVQFGYSTWMDPSGPGGMIDMQTGLPQVLCGHDCTYPVVPPAAVVANNASGIVLEADRFVHLGAGGVLLGVGVTGSTVSDSTFEDIGGTGVSVGTVDTPSHTTPVATGDTVSANTFTTANGWAVGAQYHSSPAVWAGYASHLQVIGNRICPFSGCALPSAGIAVGWGFAALTNTSAVGHNTIAGNLVNNTMQWLWDGSPIYSLGDQPGEMIRANVVRNAPQTPGGIYIDQAQDQVTVLDNIVEQVRNRLDPFTGPADEPAAAVYIHTCGRGAVTVFDTFSDPSAPTTVQNDTGGCQLSASLTLRGAFTGLPHAAMPASLCLCRTGTAGPAAPSGVSGRSSGLMSETLSWNAAAGATGFEVQQHDPTYGTVVVGAGEGSPVITGDPSLQLTYSDQVFARNAAGALTPAAPVTILG